MKRFFKEHWLVIFLVCGFSITITAPFILSSLLFKTFKETGQVGDTIGGISGPILNLLGLVLIYLSFRHQFRESQTQQEERNDILKTRHFEIIRDYISQFHKNFDNVNFDKAHDALQDFFTIDGKGYFFGNYAQDWGEAQYHNTTSDQVDMNYREQLGQLFSGTEDGRNYWHAVHIGHYIITRLKESEKFHAEHQTFLINEFSLTYRLKGMDYAMRIYRLADNIYYKPYAENVFKRSQFFLKLVAINVFCNQKIPGTEF